MYHKQDQVNLGRPSGDEHKESVSCIPTTGHTSAGWGHIAYGGGTHGNKSLLSVFAFGYSD